MKNKWLIAAILLGSIKIQAQTLSETQMRNARATGYAIVAARNPGVNFSVLMIPWDGVNTLEYNAQHQINTVWHAQAVVKGNFFNQVFDGDDFSAYSSVLLSQADFDQYKHLGTQWWIVCSVLPPFSNSISSNGGNIGIGTVSPTSNLHIYANRSIATIEATGDHASLDLRAAGNNGGGAPSVYFKRGSVNYGALFVERGTDGGNQPIFTGSNTTDFVLGSTASVPLRFGINREVKMSLDVSGKLGIGTASPGSSLHVRRDSYGEQFRISAFGDGSNGNALSIGIMGAIPATYGAQTSYYTAINNGYAGDDNSLLIINNKGYNDGEKFADFAIGNGKGTPILFADGSEAKIGIGTTTPAEKLTVNGNIKSNGNITAKKIIVSQSSWPDYVFVPAYKLKPLSELAAFIQMHQHLPDIPSAKEVEEKGISVGDNQALLLKKIEELTLYLIGVHKSNQRMQNQIEQLKKEIQQLKQKK